MRRAIAFLLLALIAWGAPAYAEVGCASCNAISVTATSATKTFTTAQSSLTIINDGANEVYLRVFTCADTSAAAVAGATAKIRLEANEHQSFTFNAKEGGLGYCAVSYVCSGGETATIRIIPK